MTVLFFGYTYLYLYFNPTQEGFWAPVTHDNPFRYRVNNYIIKNYLLNVKPGIHKDPGYYYAILI
ncbi:Uncharacterised protein [[Eubacterium] contortum]|uniref:Uncharacterized protein n=1 Tax=Faecalicatena contorta TaxID=39482 RepID=A0A174N376_9FIRM|nr:Uncharacterised protein [[Eubacterium] contortum] [Faecalicatena contorta]